MVQILGLPRLAFMCKEGRCLSCQQCTLCLNPWLTVGPEWVVRVRKQDDVGRPGHYEVVHVACACRDFILTSDDALALLGETA